MGSSRVLVPKPSTWQPMSGLVAEEKAWPVQSAAPGRTNAPIDPSRAHHFGQLAIRAPVQPKLTVSAPHDPLEQEADRGAEAVMRMPAPDAERARAPEGAPAPTKGGGPIRVSFLGLPVHPPVQRRASNAGKEERAGGEEEEQEEEEEEEEARKKPPPIQAMANPDSQPETPPGFAGMLARARGQGAPLPAATRAFMESRFAHDFSQVRIHADERAAEMARSIHARAFTRAHDVFFDAGEYQPETPAGRRLIAHELAHTVQQGFAERVVDGVDAGPRRAPRTPPSQAEAGPVLRQERSRSGGWKGQAIESALKAAIVLVEYTPPVLFGPLGPLVPLFKAGAIGFLRRLAREGGEGIEQVLGKAARSMLSPSFHLGYAKGFLRGFFIDGLAGLPLLLWDVAKLAVKLVQAVQSVLGRVSGSDIEPLLDELAALGQWLEEQGPVLWDTFIDYVKSGEVVGDVASVLKAFLTKVENLAARVGEAVADGLLGVFKGESPTLSASTGETVGRAAGLVGFIAISAAVTGGAGAGLAAARAAVRRVMPLLGRGAKLTIALAQQVGTTVSSVGRQIAAWLGSLGASRVLRVLADKFAKLMDRLALLVQRLLSKLGATRAGGFAKGAVLRPYGGPGGGHHIPAKGAFTGAPRYDMNAALAIPNVELARLGVTHSVVSGTQMTGYRAFAQTGAPLTWEAIASIEANALVRGGMAPEMARATVSRAIQALKDAGVAGPTRIPWGG